MSLHLDVILCVYYIKYKHMSHSITGHSLLEIYLVSFSVFSDTMTSKVGQLSNTVSFL